MMPSGTWLVTRMVRISCRPWPTPAVACSTGSPPQGWASARAYRPGWLSFRSRIQPTRSLFIASTCPACVCSASAVTMTSSSSSSSSFFFLLLAVAVAVCVAVAVWAAVAAGAGAVEDGVQQGDEAGDLVGFGFDAGLAQDGAGGDLVGGEQVGLGAVGPDGTADGLAVDGDVPPVQPPGGCFGPQPGAHLRVGGPGVDRADRPLDRLVAGRHVPAEPRVVPDPAAAQRFLRHRRRELRGGVNRVRAAQPGHHDHHQDRGQVMPPALGLAVVGDLRQVLQQPALPADPEPVEVRRPAPGQHRRVEPGGQRRDPARGQLIQPACLRLTVIRVVVTAAAAAVPGGRSHRSEVAGRVHRPGMGRRSVNDSTAISRTPNAAR